MNKEQAIQTAIEAMEFVCGKRRSPPANRDIEQAIPVIRQLGIENGKSTEEKS